MCLNALICIRVGINLMGENFVFGEYACLDVRVKILVKIVLLEWFSTNQLAE